MRFERQTSSDAPLKQAAHHLAMRAYVHPPKHHTSYFSACRPLPRPAAHGSAHRVDRARVAPSVPLARVAIVRAVQAQT